MKKTSKTLITLASLTFLGLGALSFSLRENAVGANAADYLNNVATFVEGTSEGQYVDSTSSGNLNADWDWTGIKNSSGTITRTYNNDLRFYYASNGEGSSVLISPDSTNTDKVLTRIKFTTRNLTNVTDISAKSGVTQAGMADVGSIAFTTGSTTATYEYTNTIGFKFFELKNVNTTNTQLYVQSIEFDYKDDATTYDPITSLTSNFSLTELFIGQEVTIAPTILPGTANQAFTLSSSNPAVTISGSTITAVSEDAFVSVTLTTIGKNALNETLSTNLIFDIVQASTTVAEALTLTPDGKIVYLVENAIVSNGYNTQYDRQIQLVDSSDPTKNILIFQYSINPLNSYRYIAGGTISFKATLGVYNSINQFTNPVILSYSDEVEIFADSILIGDTEGQCITRFADYKTQVLGFDATELAKIQNGTDADIVAASARYEAWAAYLGENAYVAGSASILVDNQINNENTIPMIIAISILSITTLAGLYFQKSKKKEELI